EPQADVATESFENVNEQLLAELERLEPYGHGNPEAVFCFQNVRLMSVRRMGSDNQHVRVILRDGKGLQLNAVAFNVNKNYEDFANEQVDAWLNLTVNEWRGVRTVEGRLIRLQPASV